MFEGLEGNQPVMERLQRITAAGRVPNALLLAGPEGVGKKQFALRVARALVCRERKDIGCGQCSACLRVLDIALPAADKKEDFEQVHFTGHPDVGMVVPYRSGILINAIRDLEKEANFRPFEADVRVFVIDDAERLNPAASNALLKTLEEPPPGTFIMLVSARPDSLLPTILSRCQMVRFSPLATEDVERHLAALGRFSSDDAALAARLSGGSLGRAIEMDLEGFRAGRDAMFSVLESSCGKPDLAAMLRVSEQMADAKNKDRFEAQLDILSMLIRDLWAASKGADPSSLINADVSGRIAEIAKRADAARLAKWLDEVEELRRQLLLNVNKRISTDALFVKMAAT